LGKKQSNGIGTERNDRLSREGAACELDELTKRSSVWIIYKKKGFGLFDVYERYRLM